MWAASTSFQPSRSSDGGTRPTRPECVGVDQSKLSAGDVALILQPFFPVEGCFTQFDRRGCGGAKPLHVDQSGGDDVRHPLLVRGNRCQQFKQSHAAVGVGVPYGGAGDGIEHPTMARRR